MITSTSNDKIKYMEKLRKSASFRHEEGLFPVEGIRMIKEIPGERVVKLYYTEKAYERYREEIDSININTGFEDDRLVSESCMKKMCDTENPQGIISAVRMYECAFEDIISGEGADKKTAPLILVLEKLQDPGNLGTIIRTSEAAGVTGIMISNDSADIYNPKVIRSTMGAIFRMKIYVSPDLPEDVTKLKASGITVYSMHLNGEQFYEKDFTKGTAFLIGNEGNGLSDELSSLADEMIRIPMMGQVESLNAAISASVAAYEALRQRIKR